jgi:hypothetical protein
MSVNSDEIAEGIERAIANVLWSVLIFVGTPCVLAILFQDLSFLVIAAIAALCIVCWVVCRLLRLVYADCADWLQKH